MTAQEYYSGSVTPMRSKNNATIDNGVTATPIIPESKDVEIPSYDFEDTQVVRDDAHPVVKQFDTLPSTQLKTQLWSDNDKGTLDSPIINSELETYFGKQPLMSSDGNYGIHQNSKGIELNSTENQAVKSVYGGQVTEKKSLRNGRVNYVIIRSGDKRFVYTGGDFSNVNEGDTIMQGQDIGIINQGSRLGFQVWNGLTPEDPYHYLKP